MPNFRIDPNAGEVEIDFDVNLPVFVMTAFTIWNGAVVVANSKVGNATPVGEADFTFAGGVPTPSILACQFDCMADGAFVGEELNLTIILRQGGHEEAFALAPVALLGTTANGVTVADARVTAKFGLVS